MLKLKSLSSQKPIKSACRRSICRHAAVGACAVHEQPAVAVVPEQPVAVVKQLSNLAELHSPQRSIAHAAQRLPERLQRQAQQHWRTQQQLVQQAQHVLSPSQQHRKCRSWSEHHASLLRTLRQQPDLLPKGCRVLLAVSGGQVGSCSSSSSSSSSISLVMS
jgi:hypothetical protein